jgi:hypothetical protein
MLARGGEKAENRRVRLLTRPPLPEPLSGGSPMPDRREEARKYLKIHTKIIMESVGLMRFHVYRFKAKASAATLRTLKNVHEALGEIIESLQQEEKKEPKSAQEQPWWREG